jgi:hypothetical protein
MAAAKDRLTKISNLQDPGGDETTPGFYVYQSADNLATTHASAYFNPVRKELVTTGALILSVCTDGFRVIKATLPADGTSDITVAAFLGAVS